MKKILLIPVIFALAIILTACGNNNQAVNVQINQIIGEKTTTNLSDSNNKPAETPSVTAPITETATSTPEAVATPEPVETKTTMLLSPDKQENLLKEYSQAVIKTSQGNITVKLYGADSPVTVNNFLNLAKAGFYNGVKFHRVIKDFMIQGGDPLSKESDNSVWGTGGPGYQFPDEINSHKLVAGSLAMANAGPGTNGSQFFIVTASATPWLDGHHTDFGEVVSGMDVVKKIDAVATGANDRPLADVVINSIELLK